MLLFRLELCLLDQWRFCSLGWEVLLRFTVRMTLYFMSTGWSFYSIPKLKRGACTWLALNQALKWISDNERLNPFFRDCSVFDVRDNWIHAGILKAYAAHKTWRNRCFTIQKMLDINKPQDTIVRNRTRFDKWLEYPDYILHPLCKMELDNVR